MSPILELTCSHCGRLHDGEALVCALCGNVLRRAKKTEPAEASATTPGPVHATVASTHEHGAHFEPPPPLASVLPGSTPIDGRFAALRQMIPAAPDRAIGRKASRDTARAPVRGEMHPALDDAARRARLEPWIFLAIGLATAPVFALTPILGYMGWFLASLVHEMGHAAFAWLCGMPAVPAISLDGHAAAVHSEQSLFLVALVGTGLAAGAWRIFEGRVRWIVLVLIAVIYPSIALTGAKELLHLLAGHGAELAFAALCLWKTLDGGFTESRLERGLYGTVGWYLLGKNMLLCWGLMKSLEARAEYNENGSFGLTNDYLRVAEDVLSCSLERVALMMLLASLCVLPAAFLLLRLSRAMRTE